VRDKRWEREEDGKGQEDGKGKKRGKQQASNEGEYKKVKGLSVTGIFPMGHKIVFQYRGKITPGTSGSHSGWLASWRMYKYNTQSSSQWS
jgi:hypothetical protein